MGKKRSRQSSNGVITGDSSESDGSKTLENSQEAVKVCPHAGKSVEQNQVKKNLHLEDIENNNFCSVCSKLGQSLQGEDLWVCLRCGAKACSLDHSLKHHEVPHSDSHALSLKLTGKIVWCHMCKTEIPSSSNKKLKGCVNNVENLYEKHLQGPAPPKNNVHLRVEQPAVAAEETNENKSKEAVPILPAKLRTSIPGNPVRGLWNLGNTCFFNSVIQCLAQTPNLVSVLKDMEAPDREVDIQLKSGKSLCGRLEKWDSLTESLAETLTEVKSGGTAFSPNHLLNLLRKRLTQFRGGDQHDAHELLRHLLDSIRGQDLKRYRRLMLNELGLSGIDNMEKVDAEKTKQLKQMDREVTEVISLAPEQVFRGFLVSRLECQECHSSSECVESFLDLSLPVMSEKPQPPSLRRKGCGGSSDEKSGAAGNQMSKHQLKKERKLARKKNRKQHQAAGAAGGRREEGQGETEPPPLAPPSSDKGGDSDEDGDAEDSDGSERRRRASATLDRSGQEEVCSGLVISPASLRPGPLSAAAAPLHQDCRVSLKDGLPDLSQLHIRGDAKDELRILIRDALRIMREEPDWSSRLKKMSGRRFILDRRRSSGESPVGEVNGNEEEETTPPNSGTAPEGNSPSDGAEAEERPEQGTEEAANSEAAENNEVVKEDNNNKSGEVHNSEEDDDDGSVVGTANLEQILEENEEEEGGLGHVTGGGGAAEEESGSVECSVLSCLAQFTGLELMTGSNKVGCETCTKASDPDSTEAKTVYTMSTKQLLISEAPLALILHLKRFQLLTSSFRKLSKHVSFPLLLDLAPFCKKDCKKRNNPEDLVYSLYGLVEHSGTLNGGHYVAYIKAETGRWYCISDSHVTEVTENRILQVQAYLLFYKRPSPTTTAPPPPSPPPSPPPPPSPQPQPL